MHVLSFYDIIESSSPDLDARSLSLNFYIDRTPNAAQVVPHFAAKSKVDDGIRKAHRLT